MYSVIQIYNILQDVWEEALDYVKALEMRSRIRGVSLYMQTFEFLFGTILRETLLRNCDNLSKALQKERLSASEGNNLSSLTVRTLKKIRSEVQFEKVENKRQDLNVNEPKLPRKRILPKRLDDGAETYQPSSVKELYRKNYFEALDLLVNCIKDRMDQPGYQLYVNLENVLLKAVSGQCYENELNFVCNFYQSDINKRNP
ncbi:LOW QUALITY PROTEIN: hypothetical protein KUTeg_000484 [Tegillarca granosa]|uniref:Uncharacterized protein n=1 Tax=Tegillarca granosa TaxID=220873 RepID=A0ABQ9FXN5_TEGGR|nr:LOW QUALITY PROTEIN: hypothetical protein KUTeg_000484 [Tegillarca granosa]